MKIKFSAAIIALSTLLFACNSSQNHSHETDVHHDSAHSENHVSNSATEESFPTIKHRFQTVDAAAGAVLQSAFQHYVHVATALANDDAKEAVAGAKGMLDALQKMDTKSLSADEKSAFENEQKTLLTSIANISGAAQDIEAQRKAFEPLSTSMYALAKGFGAQGNVYKTFCPMAFDNKGAFWLSTGTEVRNPYFGAKMLSCGEVQEMIQ